MQNWFHEAKLGIFIHWGIYSVKGVMESWAFYNGDISYEGYMAQCEGFTASKYDPKAWAKLLKQAGAKYAVLTTKHHDGVALWDTKCSDLSVVHKTSAKKDLIAPYCEALQAEELKVGLYFSHLDWSHPDYASLIHPLHIKENVPRNRFTHPEDKEDYEKWHRYLNFYHQQLGELLTNFGQVDLLWFDGGWERTADQWNAKEINDYIRKLSPTTIVNSRLWGFGDYATPEQGIPIIPPEGPWEFCMTMNDSWGYRHGDKNFKSLRQIIRTFAECIGMGGNLLLDIGPKEDGTIPEECTERLVGLGQWIKENEEAIYSTDKGLPPEHFYGASTLSKDKKALYLFVFDRPWSEENAIAVKGIQNEINKVTILKNGHELKHRKLGGAPWIHIPGILWIDLKEDALDSRTTVIKVELADELELYRGSGQEIEAN